jgi:hypothetical protein
MLAFSLAFFILTIFREPLEPLEPLEPRVMLERSV